MINQKAINELRAILPAAEVKINEPLHEHTYTRMGGRADVLVFPKTIEDARAAVEYAYKSSYPLTILGKGSNVIIQDGGIRGIVLNLSSLDAIQKNEKKVIAQSGARIIDASEFALDQKLSGLEFACGIPGSVGGAVYMNAGAYGGEIADCLESVIAVTKEGKLISLTADQLDLSYRHSNVEENGLLVLEATFQLKDGNYDDIKAIMDDLTEKRETKQPLEYPSCGSVFKRPPGLFAGKLIQDSELQGTRIGGAEVSKKHAGFIVNIDNATATDYLNVIQHVQRTVKDKFGVDLEREVRVIGEPPEM
ncbi:UDP-N-acetylmuramate dehydrogenase [Bacillus sp. NTK071]|uniref:UDP-N-acetylmuramate dehydrogenase n=1 Tax=Bacillus sp. NTK071 TaxID=2802175 RepID=UPI001A90B2E2|nr:UDP-N-acetylmuramate dehydrogenase [Bacillus sp. NTK071]MBN8207805.1 UDP-N-acetylmuramate dehydrogenase [Bacillus sp. NTK071]